MLRRGRFCTTRSEVRRARAVTGYEQRNVIRQNRGPRELGGGHAAIAPLVKPPLHGSRSPSDGGINERGGDHVNPP